MMGGSAFPNFNPAVHSLRGLAACAVMLFHWEQFFPAFGALVQSLVPANSLLDPTAYIGFGWMGVPLFFILSGWLLGGQVIRADITAGYLRHFWTRRFLRIYPAVWAELLVLLLLARSIPGLIDAASYNTLHLQFLLWLNLPPFHGCSAKPCVVDATGRISLLSVTALIGLVCGFRQLASITTEQLIDHAGLAFFDFFHGRGGQLPRDTAGA